MISVSLQYMFRTRSDRSKRESQYIFKHGKILEINHLKMGISIKIEEIGELNFRITTSGRISNIITDTDLSKFGLSHYDLNEAAKYHTACRPSDEQSGMCLTGLSDITWGALNSSFNLDRTEKIIEVKETKVVDVSSRPVLIKRQTFENNNPSVSSTFSTSISETVSNSVTSSWTNENKLSISQSIGYDIKTLKGETSLSHSRGWGSTETKSKSVTFTSECSSQMTLNPGQSATVKLMANKKIAKIEITFKCHLEGDMRINYYEMFTGKTSYNAPIEDVLSTSMYENSVIVKEFIELELYRDSSIIVN